ncbi:hypothetical protein C8A00DRAFT_34174 [Chaetomidium leptoderma]|uniref:Uncharacterized protein n=1 Tax=Chaetomidium leptoderma TaxID=669021 RepID=A0AAN6VMU8_9PEZI|nr:hypothetical protein C8A00DRAFT_34174 [Chaetomidium leptoderma]
MHNFPPSPPARSQPQRSTGAERLQTDKQKTKYGGKKKSHTTESETAVFSWRFDPGNLVPGYGGGMDGGYHQGFHQAGGYTPQTTYPDRFDFTGGFVHRPPLTYGLAPGNGGVDGPGPQTPFPYPRIIDPEDLYDRDHQPNTGTGHVGNRDGPVNQEQGDDRAMRDVDMSWGDQEWYTGDVGNRDGSVDQGQGEGRDVDMFSGEEEWNVVDHADTKDDSLVDQARSLYYHRPSYPPNIAEEDFCD